MMMKRIALSAAFALAAYGFSANPATAQSPAPMANGSATLTLTAKITAIDKANRVVTLQDDQGNTRDVQVGPGVKRFDDLKVGDTVTMAYQESVALKIVKPDSAMPMASSSPVVTRYDGPKPGGQISQTMVATVTIKAIDPSKPSVTVQTQDGKTIDMLVQDKANLQGLNVGDQVQITYSQALMIQVK